MGGIQVGPVGVSRASILYRHIYADLLLVYEVICHIWRGSLVFFIFKLGISIGRVLALFCLIQRKLALNQQLLVDLLDLFIEVGCASIELSFKVLVMVVGLEILQQQIIIKVILTEVLVTLNKVRYVIIISIHVVVTPIIILI